MKSAMIALTVCAGLAAAQHEGPHLGIDTESGQQGDQIIIQTGYAQDEGHFSFGADGYLMHHNDIHVVHLDDGAFDGDPWDGMYLGSGPRLTSDFFFPTGRQDGGDFYFEITDVSEVNGNGVNVFSWGENHNGNIMNTAWSDGASREDRSYYVRTNYHMHHQREVSSMMGMWDVTLVAWDANGMYTDSDAVTIRFHVVPAPAGAAALGLAGLVATRRRR